MTDKRFLVVIQSQRIKGFLFGSRYLRETRGASLLLDRLNRVETAKLLPEDLYACELVYLGGGTGTVLFAAEAAARMFTDQVVEVYCREHAADRIAVEVVTRDPGESYPCWMARGNLDARHRRMRRHAVAVLEGRLIRPAPRATSARTWLH